jgi:osmotically-inducible protein OsmY
MMRFVKGILGGVLTLSLCATLPGIYAQDKGNDVQVHDEVTKALSNKRFANVQSNVKNGAVTLTGSVDVYSAKEDADRRVHRVKGVVSVRNLIDVTSNSKVSDVELRDKLAEKLAYDRVGYGTTAFNNFNIAVQDGVVTLSGTAYGPMDKDSAISLVSNYPGVKDVVDNIEVAPASPMDDRIRIDVARAVYGFPSLNKYAVDPAKPIRITVVNGNVTLSGVVNNQADKDAAGIRANGVSGVFKVTNNLQVAGQTQEK